MKIILNLFLFIALSTYAQSNSNKIELITYPAEMEVYNEGELLGITPCYINIEEGEYSFRFVGHGLDEEKTVTISPLQEFVRFDFLEYPEKNRMSLGMYSFFSLFLDGVETRVVEIGAKYFQFYTQLSYFNNLPTLKIPLIYKGLFKYKDSPLYAELGILAELEVNHDLMSANIFELGSGFYLKNKDWSQIFKAGISASMFATYYFGEQDFYVIDDNEIIYMNIDTNDEKGAKKIAYSISTYCDYIFNVSSYKKVKLSASLSYYFNNLAYKIDDYKTEGSESTLNDFKKNYPYVGKLLPRFSVSFIF